MQLDLAPECRVDPDVAGNDERYTTRETMAWVAGITGVAPDAWQLDLAACAESHWAPRYYTAKDDALAQPWFPDGVERAWCNPPFSRLPAFVDKADSEVRRGPPRDAVLALLMPGNRAEQPFWQRFVEPVRDGRSIVSQSYRSARGLLITVEGDEGWRLTTHYPPGRIPFRLPGMAVGALMGSPPFGCVLLVWRWA